MEKSPEAFRTISEVANTIDLPQHVLRFWETRFPQIRPLKRAGGRRYYRPDDVERLRLIKRLLYDEGYTIKGVQKLFKEQGVQALTGGEFEPRLRVRRSGAGCAATRGSARRTPPAAPANPSRRLRWSNRSGGVRASEPCRRSRRAARRARRTRRGGPHPRSGPRAGRLNIRAEADCQRRQPAYKSRPSGRSAARLAHLSGGQGSGVRIPPLRPFKPLEIEENSEQDFRYVRCWRPMRGRWRRIRGQSAAAMGATPQFRRLPSLRRRETRQTCRV